MPGFERKAPGEQWIVLSYQFGKEMYSSNLRVLLKQNFSPPFQDVLVAPKPCNEVCVEFLPKVGKILGHEVGPCGLGIVWRTQRSIGKPDEPPTGTASSGQISAYYQKR